MNFGNYLLDAISSPFKLTKTSSPQSIFVEKTEADLDRENMLAKMDCYTARWNSTDFHLYSPHKYKSGNGDDIDLLCKSTGRLKLLVDYLDTGGIGGSPMARLILDDNALTFSAGTLLTNDGRKDCPVKRSTTLADIMVGSKSVLDRDSSFLLDMPAPAVKHKPVVVSSSSRRRKARNSSNIGGAPKAIVAYKLRHQQLEPLTATTSDDSCCWSSGDDNSNLGDFELRCNHNDYLADKIEDGWWVDSDVENDPYEELSGTLTTVPLHWNHRSKSTTSDHGFYDSTGLSEPAPPTLTLPRCPSTTSTVSHSTSNTTPTVHNIYSENNSSRTRLSSLGDIQQSSDQYGPASLHTPNSLVETAPEHPATTHRKSTSVSFVLNARTHQSTSPKQQQSSIAPALNKPLVSCIKQNTANSSPQAKTPAVHNTYSETNSSRTRLSSLGDNYLSSDQYGPASLHTPNSSVETAPEHPATTHCTPATTASLISELLSPNRSAVYCCDDVERFIAERHKARLYKSTASPVQVSSVHSLSPDTTSIHDPTPTSPSPTTGKNFPTSGAPAINRVLFFPDAPCRGKTSRRKKPNGKVQKYSEIVVTGSTSKKQGRK